MAERLTNKHHEPLNQCGEYANCYICKRKSCYIVEISDELGKLEDIMEKYGIESVEELDYFINNKINSIDDPFIKGYIQALKDKIKNSEKKVKNFKKTFQKHFTNV